MSMQPYELKQLYKQRKNQERIIRSWFGDFGVRSELTVREPKQIQNICQLNPLAVFIFEKAQTTNSDVVLGFNIDDECSNNFWLSYEHGFIYL